MGIVQMMLSGVALPVSLIDYIVTPNNWTKFYKGQMVVANTNTNTAGNVSYGRDDQTSNVFMPIAETFSLADLPFDYSNSTIIYMEYKVEPRVTTNAGGFSGSTTASPKYGVTSIYTINANANPITIYQEAYPNPSNVYSSSGIMVSDYAMQAKSVALANVPINPKDIIGTKFYQNGYNNASDSPSTLLLPGFWKKVADSGPTTFTYQAVDSYEGESQTINIYGYLMDTTTPATFSVKVGDLIIGTTMLAKHPIDAISSGDVKKLFSWSRNRSLGGGSNAHGMSIWFSTVETSYSISRALDQYPGARFLVFRFDPAGVAQPLPSTSAPPIVGGIGGCPDPNTPILLANGSTIPAGELTVGTMLYTMHETSFILGEYPVLSMDIILQDRVHVEFNDGTTIIVSASHKFLMDSYSWKTADTLISGDSINGIEQNKVVQTVINIGIGEVVKLEIADAHTYVAAGLISHNKLSSRPAQALQ